MLSKQQYRAFLEDNCDVITMMFNVHIQSMHKSVGIRAVSRKDHFTPQTREMACTKVMKEVMLRLAEPAELHIQRVLTRRQGGHQGHRGW